MDEPDSIRRRLETDLKDAMRAGDQVSRDAIRYVLAAVKNAEIDRRGELSRDEGLAVLRRLQKQAADAIDQFRAGGRTDLAEKEEAQLAVLKRYLPADVSDDELEAALGEIIAETGASGPRDMGRVMPALMARFGERADGRRLSQAVRDRLAKPG